VGSRLHLSPPPPPEMSFSAAVSENKGSSGAGLLSQQQQQVQCWETRPYIGWLIPKIEHHAGSGCRNPVLAQLMGQDTHPCYLHRAEGAAVALRVFPAIPAPILSILGGREKDAESCQLQSAPGPVGTLFLQGRGRAVTEQILSPHRAIISLG